MACRNQYCDNKQVYSKGWCQRCYRLASRNGVFELDKTVPRHGLSRCIDIQSMVTSAKTGVPKIKFLFCNKVAEEKLRGAERVICCTYEEMMP